MQSPKRPHSPPHTEQNKEILSSTGQVDLISAEEGTDKIRRNSRDEKIKSPEDGDNTKDVSLFVYCMYYFIITVIII